MSFFDVTYSGAEIAKAHAHLKMFAQHLPALLLSRETQDLDALEIHAKRFQSSFDDVIILGTGGSSLGGKTICALRTSTKPRMHFMDNVDPHTFEKLFASIDPKKTGVLVISKSGSTAETLCQFLVCLDYWKAATLAPKDHFLLISEPTSNTLRAMGDELSLPHLDHPTTVGGRFSCLTLVALLPAMIAGIDVRALRTGAASVLDAALNDPHHAAVKGAVFAANSHSTPLHVIMPYVDRFADFGMWYRQLWAESLGKEGKGLTPIRAMGTVDQHSQTQLYLDGPKDKAFTVILSDTRGEGVALSTPHISYLNGKTMGDLLYAEALATIETFKSKGCPVRAMILDQVDAGALGKLFMHYMIETVLTAHLMGIDAFDQPAVELGKVLTREYLAA